MPREIYNEGRVQGMSAYEVYVREHLSEDFDMDPATEREWLAASLASGSSILYKMPKSAVSRSDDEIYNYQIKLPTGTRLGAANTITASFFKGDAIVDTNGWASKVTSYGDLIVNDAKLTDSEKSQTYSITWTKSQRNAVKNYLKIIDGVVLQPGQWFNSPSGTPVKDLKPKINSSSSTPIIRLQIRGQIDEEFYILFTGFTIRSILSGTCGLDGSTNTYRPADGDFLGPAIYPWANKIIFTTPSSYISCIMNQNYNRLIQKRPHHNSDNADGTNAYKYVKRTSLVDMESCDPHNYYASKSDMVQPVNAKYIPNLDNGASVLTIYQRSNQFPPALWGTKVTKTGDNYLSPIDIVSEGSVKMFQQADAHTLKSYENTFPGTFAINRNDDGTLQTLDSSGNMQVVAQVSRTQIPNTNGYYVTTKTGTKQELSLSFSKDGKSPFAVSTASISKPSYSNDEITWADLINALVADKHVDILGERLKRIKQTLVYTDSNAGNCPYIEFGQPGHVKRLYICANEPKGNIPEGSIGIGWGLAT